MALEEITKGMSNAAEQINANFKVGSVVESGNNENGNYVKFGDGTMITTSKIIFGTGITTSYTLPASFLDYFGITLSSQNFDSWTLQDLALIGSGRSGNNAVTLVMNQQINRRSNYPLNLVLVCIGRWK